MIKNLIKYFSFIDNLKKKNKYEFSLIDFVNYSKIENQKARRILNKLVDLKYLKKKFYYKSNKSKFLIIK